MENLFNTKKEVSDKSKQKEAALSARPKSVLEAFEYIVELAENSNLDEDFFEKAKTHIKYASKKLSLSKIQTVLLAIFVDRSEDQSIRMSEVASYCGCRTTKILRLSNEVETLVKKRYVREARRSSCISYRVPFAVLESLRKNQPYVYEVEPVIDLHSFFDRFNSIIEEVNNCEMSYDSLLAQTEELLEEIKDNHFAKSLKRCKMENEDELLFIFMAHLFVENNDDQIMFSDLEDMYDNGKLPNYVRNQLRSRTSALFSNNLIENCNDDGLAKSDEFKLTDFAKEELLGELDLSIAGKSDKDLIKPETLVEKTLIYNASENSQISELTSILAEKRFLEVQSRLKNAGMRPGFCCLFYGAPGTGKTETVYQLAKATGRSIMRVDVDKIKSCWVGESEKNIKKLFDRYRNICRNSRLAPILLFNEADAVLGVRMEGASRAIEKMENSIQNIILQEMENLEGIMIATTNLTNNLDNAFERRFLYKVKYEKPTLESRAKIWRAMMPELSEEYANTLASMFDLSGGEIENIVRKHSVNAILTGCEDVDIQLVMDACRQERIEQSSRPRIGF